MLGNACKMFTLSIMRTLAEEVCEKVEIWMCKGWLEPAGIFQSYPRGENAEVSSCLLEFWPWVFMLSCIIYCIKDWSEHAWKIWAKTEEFIREELCQTDFYITAWPRERNRVLSNLFFWIFGYKFHIIAQDTP